MLEEIIASYTAVGNSVATEVTYTRDGGSFAADRALLVGPDHAIGRKDVVQAYRTLPKKNGVSNGAAKGAIKYSSEELVPGVDASTSHLDLNLFNLDVRIPVGQTEEEFRNKFRRFRAMINQEQLMVDLLYKQKL